MAALLAISIPLVIVAVSGGDDASESASLKVERSPDGLPEITVYVEDVELNVPETVGGAGEVTVECLDDSGEVVFSEAHDWPFTDTDDGTLDPHQHLAMEPAVIERVTRCRLRGTDPRLEGRMA